MPGPRVYSEHLLSIAHKFPLDDQAAIHLIRVLRLAEGDPIRVFNGDGHEYNATLCQVSKKSAYFHVSAIERSDARMPLSLHLGQVVSKGDRMDFTIQKATELGVSDITPLWSERCDVRLKGERLDKKVEHWQRIAISACEQSGRNRIPTIHEPVNLNQWLAAVDCERKLLLHPHNQQPLTADKMPNSVALLVGPEGGFSDDEVTFSAKNGFDGLLLGPRILRTETAALTALSVLQYVWGDFR
ncbi:16S rRNA (uracil(1498)-N(3))-methyltransferase [Thalassolituus sp.]|jgi:16S rRNA (uracil1498-N3)-methyltransferase|uniref:16S rRNA (uracil(1498)-N(3))-methyltransferase n=1 Tax=Thalassolituus sp. TaxID=2030822 RepID=UPI002A80D824|nr:16S rRNA (uracil(1498)-N(3))-methyltransferase [Thalassolituus sp.]|tara:strand:+ start:660 stop:1388 length:729 start_codon:yes stop_codon:yes gene_type:complete